MATPDIIYARGVLANWYGNDSIACDTVIQTGPKTAEARFRVPANLCSPRIRPPMFDLLKREGDEFATQTGDRDAWQHFMDKVGIKVVPGHNITGLVAEALAGGKPNYEMAGFDFIRFKKLVLPGQEIAFYGNIEQGAALCATLTMRGEKRPFTRNFRVEETEDYSKKPGYQLFLPKHWLLEHNAQGLGMMGLHALGNRQVVPVLMEAGKSSFSKQPILAGDTLHSHYAILSADEQQVYGNAQTFVGEELVADQQEFLLQFVPMENLIAAARGGVE